ncbi:MAG: hypothetical protein QOH68_1760 [Nocardioidaceae bacterium]|nr:hypothetical protein [Nocardioidaceae bacterium]
MTGRYVRAVLADAVAAAELSAPAIDPVRRMRTAQAQLARRRGYAFSLAFVALVTAVQLLPHPALAAPRCGAAVQCDVQAEG